MTEPKLIMWDGVKAMNLARLPDSAFTWFTPGSSDTDELKERYRAVPWLWRGVDLRAQAVASLPFAIVDKNGEDYDTSEDYQNAVGFLPNPGNLFHLVEASLTLLGRSYLFRLYNQAATLGLRYILAESITPIVEEALGLTGFTRQLATGTLKLDIEDLVYFWARDAFTEIGPPLEGASPAAAALQAASVLYNVDEFASMFFERGAIKAMLIKAGGSPPEEEKKRLKAFWRRAFSGAKNWWTSEIVSADVEVEIIGEGLESLANTNLTTSKREDIAVALGIPMTILWSTEAGGLGGGGVVESDERKFYEQTVVPEARFIAATLNEQVFSALDLRLVFRPETLDVFQADEAQRASALVSYVNAGYPVGLASQVLGVELPTGYDYDDLDRMKEERATAALERQKQQVQAFGGPQQGASQEAIRADLRRWRTKAKKAGGIVPFESEYIPPALKASIEATIQEIGVDTAFDFLAVKKKSSRVGAR